MGKKVMGKKVDGAIDSLIQGISQQAPMDRMIGQAELQENMSNDPEKGLLRRPPTTFLAFLFQTTEDYQFYNMELRGEQFVVATKPGVLRIFDLAGTEQTVTMDSEVANYITSTSLSFLTLDDKTYIANPEIEVAMSEDTQTYVQNSGIVFLLGGQYGRDYKIIVKTNDYEFIGEYTTPNGSTSSHIENIATTYIADQLNTSLNAATDSTDTEVLFSDYLKTTIKSDVILIEWINEANAHKLDITVEDGDGAANIFSVTNKVGDVGKLPRFAPDKYVVQITGVTNDYIDDWYLQFEQEESGFGNEGLWVECVAPDIPYKFDLTTMPHVIVEDGDNFAVEVGEWLERRVGDEETNPDPSFVGSTIQDLSSFQGRLVFLSGANVILSRTDEYEEFWMQSATTLSDYDPIDISSSALRSTPIMRRAIPHNRDLVIFSDTAQFIIFGRNAITPSNTSLVLTTSYEADLSASPVPSEKNVFYAITYGRYTGVKEFFTEGDADINASRPVTSHCTQYIDGTIQSMATSTNFNLLLCKTDTSTTDLYAYEFLWINNEKVQSAWSKWIMPWEVLHIFFIKNVIYFIRRMGTWVCIDKMEMDRTKDNSFYQTHLDSRVYVDNVNTVMSKLYDADDLVYIQGEGCPNPGLVAKIESETTDSVVFHRDMGGGTIIMGRRYLSRYIPTRPFVLDRNENPIGTGRLTVSRFVVSHQDSGQYEAKVTSQYYDDVITRFSGLVLNSLDNLVGIPAVDTGMFTVPFMHDADLAKVEFYTDSAMPMRMLHIEWIGDYIKSGTRI